MSELEQIFSVWLFYLGLVVSVCFFCLTKKVPLIHLLTLAFGNQPDVLLDLEGRGSVGGERDGTLEDGWKNWGCKKNPNEAKILKVINSKMNLRENLGRAEVEPVLLLQLELVTPELLDLLAPSNDKGRL